MKQFKYYQKQQLQPSQSSIEDESALKRHHDIRKNLYQHLLFLPLNLLKGKDILEVGCGTGESALILALYGARLTLVDANPDVDHRLNDLFKRYGVASTIRRKTFCNFDEYEDDQIFTLVTAEGFLSTLTNRDAMLRKLCSLIKPGGFCTISFPERFGSFLEFVKKSIMWRAFQLDGIKDVYSQSALNIARQLFEKSYEKLPNSRKFDVWWKDCMVSPFLTHQDCWSYDEILELLYEEKCSFYSSSPRIYEPPFLRWYKNIQSSDERKAAVLRSYAVRKYDFIFGETVNVSPNAPSLNELAIAINRVLVMLSDYFQTLNESVPVINFRAIAMLFKEIGVEHDSIRELVDLFNLLSQTQSIKELVEGYAFLRCINSSWGNSYHYLCFNKDSALSPTVQGQKGVN